MANPRQYRPGSRNARFRALNKGEYSEDRAAWVTTVIGQLVMMYYPNDTSLEEEKKEPGPTVTVLIPRPKARPVVWDITHLTMEELEKVREFFQLVFDTAEPIVRERDRNADEAFARGDDSYSRIYRQLPQLVVRQRKELSHGQSVQYGHESLLDGDEPGLGADSSGGVRGSGSSMADEGSPESSTENNEQAND